MKKLPLALGGLLLSTAPAFAHLNPAEHGSLMAGLSHPIFGLDHVLAMVTVGLWAAFLGGRATWAVPAAFVTAMAAGYGAALFGVVLPFVEPAILASVVVLGLLVAIALPVPASMGMAIVAFFALFHGYAHGGEIGAAGLLGYGFGFLLSTIILHAIGAVLGVALMTFLGRASGQMAGRFAGGVAAAGGVLLALAG